MYDDDVRMPANRAKVLQAVVNSAIDNYNESFQVKPVRESAKRRYSSEANMYYEMTAHANNISNRYHSFSETVRNILVTEALYKMLYESVDEEIRSDSGNANVMRAIVSSYVNETGYDNIMNRMRTASATMSKMHGVITKSTKSILESVDKSDSLTFQITPDMKDEFFKQLNYSDSTAISDAIRDRVSDAMKDFIVANAKDHEDITSALAQAQEHIASIPAEDKSLRECYEQKAKRRINEIRNAPKNVLHSMITAMCESVMKHPDTNAEFIHEDHIDMDKVVTRTTLMYTFMEMLNTSRLDKIDGAFIENVLTDLRR